MIKELTAENFKSLRDVKISCERVNVFIGRPNSGKSNILEVIGLLSSGYHGSVERFVRLSGPYDLFFGRSLDRTAEIGFDLGKVIIESGAEGAKAWFEHRAGNGDPIRESFFDYKFHSTGPGRKDSFMTYRFYRFDSWEGENNLQFLSPPGGGNLAMIVYSNAELRRLLQNIFSEYGLRLSVEARDYPSASATTHVLKVLHDTGDLTVSYSWSMVSDTLRRMVFFLAAVITSKDCVLAFEEPEAHAFPYYTKFLAERIALDESNQYFLATHNPYFLMSLLEKTPSKQLACFAVDLRENQTVVKRLTKKQIEEAMDGTEDVFLSVDKYFGESA
ncbi:MAG: AAA family ATPase [Deltaproteobacteria bacterium]|nr:AAA family ATPase [Deltaproteobacteria bacterium]